MPRPLITNGEVNRKGLKPALSGHLADSADPDVLGLQAFRSLDHVKLDRLALLQRTKAFTLDGGMMHEDVFAVGTAEKAEPLRIVKPLHCSLFHS